MNEATTIAHELTQGRSVAISTKGTSMRPLIKEGKCRVIVEPLQNELQTGDIGIFFLSGTTYVLHRIIAVEPEIYITRGDNCVNCEKVPKNKMLGSVTTIYKKNRKINMTDSSYRAYVRFWQLTTPLRIPFFKFRAKFKSLLYAAKRRIFSINPKGKNKNA